MARCTAGNTICRYIDPPPVEAVYIFACVTVYFGVFETEMPEWAAEVGYGIFLEDALYLSIISLCIGTTRSG